jgi:hypothetical protein
VGKPTVNNNIIDTVKKLAGKFSDEGNLDGNEETTIQQFVVFVEQENFVTENELLKRKTNEWIKVNLPWGPKWSTELDPKSLTPRKNENSFQGRFDVVQGTVLRVRNAKPNGRPLEEEILIGHVNKLGGICDDCSYLDDEDIILEYRIIDWKYNA